MWWWRKAREGCLVRHWIWVDYYIHAYTILLLKLDILISILIVYWTFEEVDSSIYLYLDFSHKQFSHFLPELFNWKILICLRWKITYYISSVLLRSKVRTYYFGLGKILFLSTLFLHLLLSLWMVPFFCCHQFIQLHKRLILSHIQYCSVFVALLFCFWKQFL